MNDNKLTILYERLGRNHLRVGLFLEQLRERDVRLIAVAEGIDTAKGEEILCRSETTLRSGTPTPQDAGYGAVTVRGLQHTLLVWVLFFLVPHKIYFHPNTFYKFALYCKLCKGFLSSILK